MLFEKKIREKKVSPYLLDVIGICIGHIIFWLLLYVFLIVFMIIVKETTVQLLLYTTVGLMAVIVIDIVWVIAINFNMFKRGISSLKKRTERSTVKDVELIHYCSQKMYEGLGRNKIQPFGCWLSVFFRDDLFRCVYFLTLPAGNNLNKGRRLFFPIPPKSEVPTFKEYKKLTEGDRSSVEPFNEGEFLNSIKSMQKYGNPDYRVYWYYISYTKAQELNRLFELVSPHLFQIVVDEKKQVLKEFHPIPGREYPPEALECMEKINQMYP